jgi:hypothetical protein
MSCKIAPKLPGGLSQLANVAKTVAPMAMGPVGGALAGAAAKALPAACNMGDSFSSGNPLGSIFQALMSGGSAALQQMLSGQGGQNGPQGPNKTQSPATAGGPQGAARKQLHHRQAQHAQQAQQAPKKHKVHHAKPPTPPQTAPASNQVFA